jgi:release factor glutamine methyltransferase
MSTELWPIRRLLHWTQQFLRDKGIESARLEAEILLGHALGCKRIDLYVCSEELTTEEQRATFKALIKKRVEGCPVAYLVGRREFYQLAFDVTPAVLIPRPESEHLVMECLRLIKGKESPRILDVGTGSGCIALSVAHQHKTADVTGVDISLEALEVARRNAARHGLQRVRFLAGDLFDPVQGEKFDAIVSNPPYIAAGEFAGLAKEVREFEPKLALDGGPDGLTVYRRLIPEAASHLAAGGHLLLEIGATQEKAVRELIESTESFDAIAIHLDGQRLPRVVDARKK